MISVDRSLESDKRPNYRFLLFWRQILGSLCHSDLAKKRHGRHLLFFCSIKLGWFKDTVTVCFIVLAWDLSVWQNLKLVEFWPKQVLQNGYGSEIESAYKIFTTCLCFNCCCGCVDWHTVCTTNIYLFFRIVFARSGFSTTTSACDLRDQIYKELLSDALIGKIRFFYYLKKPFNDVFHAHPFIGESYMSFKFKLEYLYAF